MSKPTPNSKVALLILDGWGLGNDYEGNAITRAKTPNWDRIWQHYPTLTIEASGEAVGLPDGQMGNSEVGHFTIGAGQILFQDLTRINKAINDGGFLVRPAFVNAFEHVNKFDSTLHLMGLVSDGGVHSHLDHLIALIEAAQKHGVKKVNIHAFLDGRDTPPQSAIEYMEKLEAGLEKFGLGNVASVCGRFYAMDRDKKWDRIDAFYEMVIGKKAAPIFSHHDKAIRASYSQGINDEHVVPCLVQLPPGRVGTVQSQDAVIFFNFRNDRMLELSERFIKSELADLHLASMSEYSEHFPFESAFQKQKPQQYLGQVIADAGLKQLRTTETEKSAHMTFFMNCQNEGSLEGEDRMIFDSNSVASHAEMPAMRAKDITEHMVQVMDSGTYPVILSNICNGDMLGHTGDIPAAIEGCEVVDACLADLEAAALRNNYHLIVIADHGNVEEMKDQETGEPQTAHTTNLVPFIFISGEGDMFEFTTNEGGLVDIAPTILSLLGLEVPQEMSGKSLLQPIA